MSTRAQTPASHVQRADDRVYEVNHILIRRVREATRRLEAGDRQRPDGRSGIGAVESTALLRCCETWIAEQSHRWAAARK